MKDSNIQSQVTTSALQATPSGSIGGSPSRASIEAQAMAAKSSQESIQEVNLNADPQDGGKKAANVSFPFIQDGREAQLNVPLLTIVPIPYIAVEDIDLNFKASISASSSSVSETSSSESLDAGGDVTAGLKIGPFHLDAKPNANYSSKKDSKATEDSKYGVECTMDAAVKAGQDSMPAGLDKVLELLGSSLNVLDPKGTLEVNATHLKVGDQLIATYKNKEGIYEPTAITCDTLSLVEDGDSMTCEVMAGSHTLKAGERTVVIEVEDKIL